AQRSCNARHLGVQAGRGQDHARRRHLVLARRRFLHCVAHLRPDPRRRRGLGTKVPLRQLGWRWGRSGHMATSRFRSLLRNHRRVPMFYNQARLNRQAPSRRRPRSVGVAGCTRTFSFVVVGMFAVRPPLSRVDRSQPARRNRDGVKGKGPGLLRGLLAVGVARGAQKSIPPPPGMGGAGGCFFGTSATMASVVIRRPAIEAASCSAVRTTLVGSMMPFFTRSTYSPVWASKPKL